MKTLTIGEAAGNLANWLKQAAAGEEIVIRSGNAEVALQPVVKVKSPGVAISPREALRQLQQDARLTPDQADNYLREVHAERLAAEA